MTSMAAVASERQRARGAMERRERVSGVEGEPLASTRESTGALVHAAWRWNTARAWPPRTGHASSVGAFPRTPGEQRIEHGGAQVWASYGPIWFVGPKQTLLYTACSTFLI